MKTEDEAATFMKLTYYRSSLLILNQKSIIIRSMKRLIKPHFANEFHPYYFIFRFEIFWFILHYGITNAIHLFIYLPS